MAFWWDEDSANPDHEVLVALRASMASVPEAMLIALTSVYGRRGEVWRTYERHFGKDRDDILVVNGSTRDFNPTILQRVIDAAMEDDAMAASAEYLGHFRRDIETFLPLEALEAVRMRGRFELPPLAGVRYVAFLDPAGGTGKDSMTLAIAHQERGVAVLDAVREARPPFNPSAVVAEFAAVARTYRVTRSTSDRYAGAWPVEAFAKEGVVVAPSERVRSEIYLDALPLITSGSVELLDHAGLLKQLAALERRTSRQGRDSVDHAPHQHDDLANAACGALVLARTQATTRVGYTWGRRDMPAAKEA